MHTAGKAQIPDPSRIPVCSWDLIPAIFICTCWDLIPTIMMLYVGKSWKRTWPSDAGNTSHTASPSYTAIFHKVCVDLINSSQLLLNYIRTSLQVAVDHLGRSTW